MRLTGKITHEVAISALLGPGRSLFNKPQTSKDGPRTTGDHMTDHIIRCILHDIAIAYIKF